MHSNVRVKNPSGTDSSTVDRFAEDVEAEINSLFHQMFSGEVAVDAMIQMLARYKESSEKRYALFILLSKWSLYEFPLFVIKQKF